jgi:hypothetical protein
MPYALMLMNFENKNGYEHFALISDSPRRGFLEISDEEARAIRAAQLIADWIPRRDALNRIFEPLGERFDEQKIPEIDDQDEIDRWIAELGPASNLLYRLE